MTHNFPLYLDYAATTPVDSRVAEKMNHYLTWEGIFGNPASLHSFGVKAKEAVEEAREQVAHCIHGVTRGIIFTSGATEANNLAIKGVAHFYQAKGKHIVTTKAEHKSVLDVCASLEQEGFEVTYLEVNRYGLIDLEQFRSVLKKETVLVSILHVNNETGVVQDIKRLSEITREAGVFFHMDAAQSLGKVPIDLRRVPIDLLSLSAHKCYGPKGIGALYVNDNPRVRLTPLLHGGRQERTLRAGTLPTHQIVGLGTACSLVSALEAEIKTIQILHDTFWQGIQNLPNVSINGHDKSKVPHIINVRLQNVDREVLRARLENLAFSYASACNTMSLQPSHVLQAMGLTKEEASRSIRFSFGRFTTLDNIDAAIGLIRTCYLQKEENEHA